MSSAKRPAPPAVPSGKMIEKMIQGISILVVDDNPYMRWVTRMMLVNLGAKQEVRYRLERGKFQGIHKRSQG